jgi:formate dehydrogenase subunit beta
MNSLTDAAIDALRNKKADFIIGYTSSINGTTKPFIARTEEEAGRLSFNNYSVNNLAVYLTHKNLLKKGKPGIVAKGCDVRAIIALIQENQIKREDVFIIGVNCNGVVKETAEPFGKDNTQVKCKYCQIRTPHQYDVLVGELSDFDMPEDSQLPVMERLDKMSAGERWDFWQAEFDKCIKCYACRQACPLCYCEQCIVEKSNPQWIETSATSRGNFAWNIIRAFHQAGRCIGCHECERACPMDIPFTLLTRKMGMLAGKEFNYRHGMNASEPTLIGTFNIKDKEDFIK